MATAIPFGWQVENSSGVPVSGAKIYFYAPDTVTARTPFTDKALAVPSANPVIADAAGWFNVYLSSELGYDIVIKSADDSITYYSASHGVADSIATGDEILLSGYAATQAGFVEAAEAAIAAGKWLNGEEIAITLTSLMTITLTGPLRWRNVRLSKLTQSAVDYEYAVTVNGPDFSNVTTLGANASIGAASLTVSSATNIVAGGKYLLISDTNYNPDPAAYGNSVSKVCEWVRVDNGYTSGTSVALAQTLQSSYTTAASARLYRFLETATVEFDNVVITGGGAGEAQGAIRFNKCVIERFTDCGSENNEYAGFTFNLCGFNSYVSGWVENADLSGYGYGFEMVGCDAPLIDWAWGENVRHVVTRGSSFLTTLPSSGGSVYILGRGGQTASVTGIRSTGSVDDVHAGHVGHTIGTVSGDLVGGNAQEAVTCESHAISYGSVKVTGADNGVTVLYYGHPADEAPAIVTFGDIDCGYGGASSNHAVIALNRDANTRNAFTVSVQSINARWPGLIYAGATQGEIIANVDTIKGVSRTTHSVQAASSANGRASIAVDHPDYVEDSGNASIYAVHADGDAYNTAVSGFGSYIDLGPGNITADNTAFYANDAQITVRGTRGTASKTLAGIGAVLVPNEVKSSVLAVGSATSLTTATATTITSVSLEPGVWRITGIVAYRPDTTTSVSRFITAISATTNALPSTLGVDETQTNMISAAFVPGTINITQTTGEAIVTLTATTTYYLIGHATFTVSTLTAFGKIQATRLS